MQASRWTALTLCTFLLGAGIVAGSSYALDIFGIFRDPKGKPKTIFHNERTSKFLLNDRYVPTNFDALLVGGSSTSNWPMAALDFARFYNESLYGANYVEEKRLVDEALRRGSYRYAIFVINPYPMQFHDIHEGDGKAPRWQALGSVNLLREEFYMALQHLRHTAPQFSPDGGQKMPPTKGGADPYPASGPLPYDPVALDALRQTLEELRAQGARIIFVQTPLTTPVYDRHREQLQQFYAAFPLRKPGEVLIDFTAPEYREFSSDLTRWVDPPHLNDASAKLAVAELNRAIHAAIPELKALPQ